MDVDRLSSLGDGALRRVLSFLPSSKEAARTAALSRRWRDAFAGADAVSMEEPERALRPSDYEDRGCGCMDCGYGKPVDPNPPPPFATAVTAALLARHRPDAPPLPLRALRVALNCYRREDASQVDHWVSYALKHAAAVGGRRGGAAGGGLEICLRLRRGSVCWRKYSLVARREARSLMEEDNDFDTDGEDEQQDARRGRTRSRSQSLADSDEEEADRRAMPRRRRSVSGEDQPRHMSTSLSRSPSRSRSGSLSVSDGGGKPVADDYDEMDDAAASDYGNHFANSPGPEQPSASRSPDSRSSSNSDDPGAYRSPTPRSPRIPSPSPSPPPGEDDDVVSVVEYRARPDSPEPAWKLPPPEYTVPRTLFSCAKLRSLGIGPCRLSPPPAISLPSLETLLLTNVPDEEEEVQRLVAACPRLADLTLEACGTVTALSLLVNPRLRRLALRCCHRLATVAVGTLHSFEYRGAVPKATLLTFHGRGGGSSFASCKVDICGEEVSSVKELAKLGEFLRLLASTKHLHLQSARLGSGVDHDALAAFPAFTNLLHLELTGRLPHDDDGAALAAVRRILRHAPSLGVLSLFFDTGPSDDELRTRQSWLDTNEGVLLDSHHLKYNEHEVLLDVASAAVPPCLRTRSRVREINLVHYHGGRAQRTLAKFLICNSLVLDKLYCGFARGPLWIQTKLRDEIQGWAMNKAENIIFC